MQHTFSFTFSTKNIFFCRAKYVCTFVFLSVLSPSLCPFLAVSISQALFLSLLVCIILWLMWIFHHNACPAFLTWLYTKQRISEPFAWWQFRESQILFHCYNKKHTRLCKACCQWKNDTNPSVGERGWKTSCAPVRNITLVE